MFDMNAVSKAIDNVKLVTIKNSPAILTVLGASGLVSTVLLAIRASFDVAEILEDVRQKHCFEMEEGLPANKSLNFDEIDAARKLTKREIILLSWKRYIPTAVVGAASLACIIGSHSINTKRNAALASLYTLAQTAMDDYQTKVVEQIGKNKEEKVRAALDQDKLDKNPVTATTIVVTGQGKVLFFDTLSSRYFESDVETVRQKLNDFNFRLINDFYRPLNEWYDDIGLDPIEIGNDIGWKADTAKLNMTFTSKLVNDRPVVVINYSPLPIYIY